MSIWTDLTGIPFSVSWVDAGGLATRSLRAGSGEPVIFMHGTSGHLEAFTRNIAAHVSAGFECHAIDAMGHGYTDGPGLPYEIPGYVEHLVAYMDSCGIERAHIVGESLGGWIGGWLASEQPDRVGRLELVAAGGTKANPEVMERLKTSTRNAVHTDDPELTRQRLNLLFHDPSTAVSDELVEVRHRIYHTPEFVAAIDHLLALQEMEIRQRNLMSPERLARIESETLVVWGTNNPFGAVPEAQAMADAIPRSHLEIFEDCGHWPQHEHADRFNELSVRFLKGEL